MLVVRDSNFPLKEYPSCVEGDPLFGEFKTHIQQLKISHLPLRADQAAYLASLLASLSLIDSRLFPNTNQTAPSRRLQAIHDKFVKVPLKDRVQLAQCLFSGHYDYHQIYYFVPYVVINSMYPELEQYINFRESSVQRIFTPKGIRFAVEKWKASGKLTSHIEYSVCENVFCLDAELHKLNETSTPLKKAFFLQMDLTPSLEGDHTVLIFLTKSAEKLEIIITDGAGNARGYVDAVARHIHSLLPQSVIKAFAVPRQVTSHSCLMFALYDARMISEDPDCFMDFINSLECEYIDGAPYAYFSELPQQMMQLSQTQCTLQLILKTVKKNVIFLKHENDTSFIENWRQKGLLITDQQASKSTNILANKLFAKFERSLLATLFSDTLD